MEDKLTCETCDWWDEEPGGWCSKHDDYNPVDGLCHDWTPRIEDEPCEDGGCRL